MSYSVQSLMAQGREHWREFQPKRYKKLKAAGELESELKAAAELTLKAMATWREVGYTEHEAWAATRELYLIVPEEG